MKQRYQKSITMADGSRILIVHENEEETSPIIYEGSPEGWEEIIKKEEEEEKQK